MKELRRFTKKRFTRLQHQLNKFPVGDEKEALHQVRLEIKKIKALLRLIHFNDIDFDDHKQYLPFRTIFREAGKLRDEGLRQELLEQYTIITNPFPRIPGQSIKRFTKKTSHHIKLVRQRKKEITKKITSVKSHTYSMYLCKKKDELNNFLSGRLRQSDLHLLRKLIKEIIYLTSVKKKKHKIDSFLMESSALIGSWHDKQVLIPWIQSNTPKAKATIIKLKSECNADLQKLKKLIQDR